MATQTLPSAICFMLLQSSSVLQPADSLCLNFLPMYRIVSQCIAILTRYTTLTTLRSSLSVVLCTTTITSRGLDVQPSCPAEAYTRRRRRRQSHPAQGSGQATPRHYHAPPPERRSTPSSKATNFLSRSSPSHHHDTCPSPTNRSTDPSHTVARQCCGLETTRRTSACERHIR